MAKQALSLKVLWHSNDGHLGLSINGSYYEYWIDNAKALAFITAVRKQKTNKGRALAIFKREATLLCPKM